VSDARDDSPHRVALVTVSVSSERNHCAARIPSSEGFNITYRGQTPAIRRSLPPS
jgi:hypothetical protein